MKLYGKKFCTKVVFRTLISSFMVSMFVFSAVFIASQHVCVVYISFIIPASCVGLDNVACLSVFFDFFY